MADFLQYEVPTGVGRKISNLTEFVVIQPLPVQIAGDHHVVRNLGSQGNHISFAHRRIAIRFRGFEACIDDVLNGLGRGNHSSENSFSSAPRLPSAHHVLPPGRDDRRRWSGHARLTR